MSKKSYWDRLDDWEMKDDSDAYLVYVARIEAVQKKWPGGLAGYLKEYHAEQNDGIVSNYAVGLDFERQLVDLSERGLEIGGDFVFIDARDGGATLDGAPFQMPVSWLGGFYKNGRVMVFLKH